MSNTDSSRTPSPVLNVLIREKAASNIARAASTSDSSFKLYMDPAWSNEEYTREIPLSSWRTKRPSPSQNQSIDIPSSSRDQPIDVSKSAAEMQKEVDELIQKGKEIFSGVPKLLSPLKTHFLENPIEIISDSSVDSLGEAYYDLKGGGDNEVNSDDTDYEEPSSDDGDLDEVSRVINFEDYLYVPEASPEAYVPTPQPKLEGTIFIGGPRPEEIETGSNVKPG